MINVANVIEEGRFGGPQMRMVTVARALQPDINTIIFMPFLESTAFQEKCLNEKVTYSLVKLSRLNKSFSAVIKYILTY